jgi:hypothetical protein
MNLFTTCTKFCYMKKLLFLFVMLILAARGIAQPVTAIEMLDMLQCKSNGCVSAMLIPKGFEAGNKNETEDFSVYEYYSKVSEPYDDNPWVVLPNRVEYSLTGKSYIVTLMFYTGSRHIVDGIIADFGTRGFVPVTDTLAMTGDNLTMEFTSPQYPKVHLVLTQIKKEMNEQQYTEYAFNLKLLPENKASAGK